MQVTSEIATPEITLALAACNACQAHHRSLNRPLSDDKLKKNIKKFQELFNLIKDNDATLATYLPAICMSMAEIIRLQEIIPRPIISILNNDILPMLIHKPQLFNVSDRDVFKSISCMLNYISTYIYPAKITDLHRQNLVTNTIRAILALTTANEIPLETKFYTIIASITIDNLMRNPDLVQDIVVNYIMQAQLNPATRQAILENIVVRCFAVIEEKLNATVITALRTIQHKLLEYFIACNCEDETSRIALAQSFLQRHDFTSKMRHQEIVVIALQKIFTESQLQQIVAGTSQEEPLRRTIRTRETNALLDEVLELQAEMLEIIAAQYPEQLPVITEQLAFLNRQQQQQEESKTEHYTHNFS